MFGEPCPCPNDLNAVMPPFAWTQVHKLAPKRMRNGRRSEESHVQWWTRHGKAATVAETHTACVEQHAPRLRWALVASLNLMACGISNAFAEAPGSTCLLAASSKIGWRIDWHMTPFPVDVSRINISHPIVKLSQHSAQP
jgi:hypothetical protein